MRLAFALLLATHGFAHLVGFVGPWKLSADGRIPYKTTLVGGAFDVGDVGIKLVGLLWLFVALALCVAAGGALFRAPWWPGMTVAALVASAGLCVLGWPDAKLGVLVDFAVLALLLVGTQMGWASGHG